MPPASPSAVLSDRQRNVLLSLAALLFLFLFLSLSAQHNAPSSPSASKAATYLPSLDALSRLAPSDEHDPLAYRRFLEQTTSPASFTTHSPTLTFDHIYVLSLPSRIDRRAEMRKLASALGIEITFVDAADKHEPFIQWIAERVQESRELRKSELAKARKVSPSSIGGLHIGCDWLTPYLTPSSTRPFPAFPAPSSPSLRSALASTKSSNWVEHLEALHSLGRHTSLRPSSPRVNVTSLLWDPLERVSVRQVTPGVLSTYWGQTRAIKLMRENGDRTALVLEDDVDLEWDLERLWATIERRLPRNDEVGTWDVVYLGHCWGGEFQKPQYLHPLLHRSTGPMCLHGYALTAAGAARILAHLSSPWSAFSTAVDVAVPTLVHFEQIESWSVAPPLVVQRKDGPSDLQKGNGSRWRGVLRDSTHERVMRDDGTWDPAVWDDTFDPRHVDPATQLRCGPV
ncbi:hypothetical protein JCM1841_002807 [Sporobolomyces salmonicolor]